MPMKNPPHPGDFIRTEIIEAAGLTVTAAAKALRVSRPTSSSFSMVRPISQGIWPSASRKPLASNGYSDAYAVFYDIAQTRKR